MTTYSFFLSGDVIVRGLSAAEVRLLKRVLRRLERVGFTPWGPDILGAINLARRVYSENRHERFRHRFEAIGGEESHHPNCPATDGFGCHCNGWEG